MRRRNALDVLAPYHSWQLQRVSRTNFPPDVVLSIRRAQEMTDDEIRSLLRLVKTGTCYRCRIGKGKYHFADSPLDAARLAAAAEKAAAKATEKAAKAREKTGPPDPGAPPVT